MNDQNTLQMQPGAIDERLGLNVHRNHWPAAPALKAVEAAGFAWVQVHTPPAAILADREQCRRHARALRATLDTSGLRLLVHGPDDLSAGTLAGDRAVRGLLDYAGEAGAELVAYHGRNYGGVHERVAARALAEERSLRAHGERAAALGITIAVENLAPVWPGPARLSHDPIGIRDLVRAVDSPGVGMLLDLGHAHLTAALGGLGIEAVLRAVAGDVVLFHLHDNLGARRHQLDAPGVDPLRLDLHLAPGNGTLPWERVAAALRAHRAPLMLEIEPSHRPGLVALATITRHLLGAGAPAPTAATAA
jgi:sugar phosphate isomerase/epimerase